MPDQKALKILFNRFWSGEGWTRRPVSDADFAYARAAGVMFDQVCWSHDDVVRRIRYLVAETDPTQVGHQFLASLSSRRLDLRSALSSYAVGLRLPAHNWEGPGPCPLCGLYDDDPTAHDLNIYSFERFKWGGVRHLDLSYVAFDLDQFVRADWCAPTPEDFAIFSAILKAARALPARARPADLQKAIAPLFKSNAAERQGLIQSLAITSILASNQHPGFLREFIPADRRPEKTEWGYPADWWRGVDGMDEEALLFFFPFREIEHP